MQDLKITRMRNAILCATTACNVDAGFTQEQADELAQVLDSFVQANRRIDAADDAVSTHRAEPESEER